MTLGFCIYLLGVVDSLKIMFAVAILLLCIASIICGVFSLIGISNEEDDTLEWKLATAWLKRCVVSLLIVVGLQMLTPSAKTTAAMYLVPAIANNEKLQEIGGNSLKLLQKLSRKWLLDLADDGKKAKEDV